MNNISPYINKSNDFASPAGFIQDCLNYMASHGLPCPDIIQATGLIRRYSCENNTRKRNEWYVGFEGLGPRNTPFLVCVFGSWKTGEKHVYKSWSNNTSYTSEEHAQLAHILKEKRDQAELLLKKSRDDAALEAKKIWDKAPLIATSEKYLAYPTRKKIDPIGARFYKDMMIIDVRNESGEIRSLQGLSVFPDGKTLRDNFSGGEMVGNFHIIGPKNDPQCIVVSEGYSTGMSIHMATSYTIFVAMCSSNIKNIIPKIQVMYPGREIIIAGDIDDNGRTAANQAAKSFTNCRLVFPVLPDGNDGTDFNDLHIYTSLDEVKRQIEGARVNTAMQDNLDKLANRLVKKDDPCAGFTIDIFPDIMKNYLISRSKVTKSHPLIISTGILTTVAATLGKNATAYYFGKIYANLYFLSISKSGTFKSSGLREGTRLLEERSSEINKMYRDKKKSLGADKNVSNSNELADILRQDPVFPNDMTSEAFYSHLAMGQSGAIIQSEFGGWLKNMSKEYQSGLKINLVDYYDVPELRRKSTVKNGDITIENPYLCICGVSTLAWIQMAFKSDDIHGGLLPRFLIMVVPEVIDDSDLILEKPDPQDLIALDVFRTFLNRIRGIRYDFTYTQGAKDYLNKYAREIKAFPKSYTAKTRETLELFVPRWSAYLVKVAMNMQVMENPNTEIIDELAVIRAYVYISFSIRSTATLIGGELVLSPWEQASVKVYEYIVRKSIELKGPVRRAVITASKVLVQGMGPQFSYAYILDKHVEEGMLTMVKGNPENETTYMPTIQNDDQER